MNKKVVLLLTLACTLVYVNSLMNGFVLDDKALIVYNPLITSARLSQGLFTKGIFYSFSSLSQGVVDQPYRPLQMLTYFLDYSLWGLRPFGFHLNNMFIHLGNSILLFFLLYLFFENRLFAAATSIFFLVHPLHTSVVSYISGRADLLSGFFMLLGLLFLALFLRNNKQPYYAASLCAAFFALFSRENALIMPFFVAIVLLAERVKLRKYLLIVPFLLVDIFYVALRFLILGHGGVSVHQLLLPMPLRVVNFLNCITHYIKIIFLPLDLHLQRITPFILRILSFKSALLLLFFFGLLLAMFRFRKYRGFLFGMVWFLAGLAPVFFYLDGYPLLGGAMMAESWAYFSLIGFSAAFVSATLSLKRIGKTLIVCFCAFYGTLTFANNFYWKNDLLLLKRTLAFTSSRNPLRRNLINEYLYYGLYDDARREIEIYAKYYSNTPELDESWGNYYAAVEKFPDAVARYSRVLEKKNDFFLQYQLSSCYKKMNEPDMALEAARSSFALNPRFILNLIQLGDLYVQKKQIGEAKKYYKLALEVNPHNQALRELLRSAK